MNQIHLEIEQFYSVTRGTHQETVSKAPSTIIQINLKMHVLFFGLAYCPHKNGIFGHQKHAGSFSKTVSTVETFENSGLVV